MQQTFPGIPIVKWTSVRNIHAANHFQETFGQFFAGAARREVLYQLPFGI